MLSRSTANKIEGGTIDGNKIDGNKIDMRLYGKFKSDVPWRGPAQDAFSADAISHLVSSKDDDADMWDLREVLEVRKMLHDCGLNPEWDPEFGPKTSFYSRPELQICMICNRKQMSNFCPWHEIGQVIPLNDGRCVRLRDKKIVDGHASAAYVVRTCVMSAHGGNNLGQEILCVAIAGQTLWLLPHWSACDK